MTGPGCVKRQPGPLVCFCIQSAVAGEAPALFNWKVILKSERRRSRGDALTFKSASV